MNKLGIIDYRNIIKTVRSTYSIDFNDFAMTSFKRKLEQIIIKNKLGDADGLINKIKIDENFKKIFLNEISIDDTEMFRDPSLWREMKFILNKEKNRQSFKIWFPEVSSGEELYSFLILLKEIDLLDKVLSGNLMNFYDKRNNKAYMHLSLLKNTDFKNYVSFNENFTSNFHMIFFRNKMIYFNKTLQMKMLRIITNSLYLGGYFVIGIKEKFDNFSAISKFMVINRYENIYKKIV
ncbi:MAG: hypothetical protein B6I24_01360 [Bacteroidetes bacterium 4572_128]|nr:MAG: hypothetical protein B6I24_01360 [Bacteroidetes bacterium 4572_128]